MSKAILNRSLHTAKSSKNDEYYTQLADIEKELKYYKNHFRGKVVYCNCDDPRVSNFFHYFFYNFRKLGLKKLIATCYRSINPDLFSQNDSERAIYLEYDGSEHVGNDPDIREIDISNLNDDGDFRSKESIELLKQSDIVVTNPPFSLFREYVAQLIEYDKKFVIIGNKNAITYREIFKLIKEDKIWVGNTPMGTDMLFDVSNDFAQELISNKKEGSGYRIVDGVVKGRAQAAWFTNLDIAKRHEDLILYRNYNNKEYPTYDNYDAINVDRTQDIPVDYKGNMGVPITFLDKYNPAQFEIIGLGISNSGLEIGVRPYKPEHKKYRKEVQKRGAVDGDLYLMENGVVDVPYARIIIKNKRL